ncbi:hypothetical protein ASE63_03775 [Bosea sp. Root381]|uniref:hypothetical protein n=1 Tax=Bosea sp. Root381 TaxID=1736524 RepID=UPI0006FAF565|nr:hypothetical protein [Bosea sp. Root381]KRE09664.1 hypothetical protein ASE63_03775 [Bosea sp. Root381]
MMKLPVFAVVTAALRDFARFLIRHPLAVLLAMACCVLLDRWLGLPLDETDDPATFAGLLQSCMSVLAQFLVCLPLWLVAVREVVSGTALPLRLDGPPSPATQRYALFNAVLLLAAEPILLLDGNSPLLMVVIPALLIGSILFSLRATLTFTSLALGRLDLGFARSIAKTSGQTLRLLAILLLPLAAFAATALALMLLAFMSGADPELNGSYWSALAVITAQLFMICAAIAGAHIYRRLEADLPQNGRY